MKGKLLLLFSVLAGWALLTSIWCFANRQYGRGALNAVVVLVNLYVVTRNRVR